MAIKAAKEAGKVLRNNFGSLLKVRDKKDKSLVTDIDLLAEEKIVKLIKAKYPQDNILSEESKYEISNSDFKWIIDPLDGTHNYIRGIENFGTSIAVAWKDKVVVGIIYLPMAKELYVAQKSKGAYGNGKRINVSKRNLRQSTLIYDSSIRYNKEPMLKCFGEIVDRVFNIRMFGSTVRSLSYIAEGKAELEIEWNDKVWDFAAGLLLVEEAGGKATDFAGEKWNLSTTGYIVSNGKVHKDILGILRICERKKARKELQRRQK